MFTDRDPIEILEARWEDLAEADAADPSLITDEDRAWADEQRRLWTIRVAEAYRELGIDPSSRMELDRASTPATESPPPAPRKRGCEGPKEPFVPDEAWIEAFDRQYRAPHLDEQLKLFARSRSRAVAFYGRVVDEYYIREVVADVVADTHEGVIRWDPKRVDLKKHLLDSIGYRIRDDCKRADTFKHLDIDKPRVEDEASYALAHAHAPDEERAHFAAAATAALDGLRELAGADIEVVMLIDGFRTGAIEKAELLVVTGLTSAQYKAARVRLARLARRLPEHLRAAAMRSRR